MKLYAVPFGGDWVPDDAGDGTSACFEAPRDPTYESLDRESRARALAQAFGDTPDEDTVKAFFENDYEAPDGFWLLKKKDLRLANRPLDRACDAGDTAWDLAVEASKDACRRTAVQTITKEPIPAGRGSHGTTVDAMSDQEVRRTLKKLQEDYRSGLYHESSEDIATFVHDTLQEAGLDVSPLCEEEEHEE